VVHVVASITDVIPADNYHNQGTNWFYPISKLILAYLYVFSSYNLFSGLLKKYWFIWIRIRHMFQVW